MFRFVFLAAISVVVSRCQQEEDPLVGLQENDDISSSRGIHQSEQFLRRANGEPKKLVCYSRQRAANARSRIDRFTAEDVDPYLCTHIIITSAALDVGSNSIRFVGRENLESLVSRKQFNPNLKIMLSIGGTREPFFSFSDVFNDSRRRWVFVKNTVAFLRGTGLDGIDIDWRYTVKRTPADRGNYTLAIEDLRAEFDQVAKETAQPRYLLSITLPKLEEHIDKGYDLPAISPLVDFMNVLAFLYHDSWEPQVNHHAPIYHKHEQNEYQYEKKLTVNHTISYLIEKGADARKLVLGIPTFGPSYALRNFDNTAIGALAKGPGKESEITQQQGYLAYLEICQNINDKGWTVENDKEDATGPYAFNGHYWVSYDSIHSARLKGKFANEKGLGGLMFYTLDMDDFNGTCHNNTYFPIINAAKEEFLLGESVIMEPLSPSPYSACSLQSQNAKEREVNSTTILANRQPKMVVCVFNLAATERIGIGRFTGEDVDPFLCTHVIATGTGLYVSLNSIGSNYKIVLYLESLKAKKRYNPDLKIILSVGGPLVTSDSFSDIFYDRIRRAEFVQNVVKFLSDFGLDGIEIDWEYTVERTPIDKRVYTLAIKEFHEEFDKVAKRTTRPRFLLSIRLPKLEMHIDGGYDLPAISPYVDFMSVEAFLYHGWFEPRVNHNAPIYYQQDENEYQYDRKLTVNHTISYLIEKGADAGKLVLGIPSFSITYTLTNFSDTILGAGARGPGEESVVTRIRGNLAYNEICRNINDGGWTVVDNKTSSMGPYAYSGYEWVSYDSMNSARLKGAFANEQGLRGLAFFLIDLDDFKGACHNKTRFPIINAAKGEFLLGESVTIRPVFLPNDEACSNRSQNAQNRGG